MRRTGWTQGPRFYLLLVTLLVLTVVPLLAASPWERAEPVLERAEPVRERGEPSRERDDASPGTDGTLFLNPHGGYEVVVPRAWRAVPDGVRTTVSDPRRTVVIGISPSRPTALERLSTQLVAAVRRDYDDVRLIGRDVQSTVEREVHLISGFATSRRGVELRWLVAALVVDARTFAATVFADRSIGPDHLMPPVQQLLSTLRSSK